MVTLDEPQVATIGDQEFSIIQESGQPNNFVHIDFRVFLKICVVPYTFV